MFVTSSGTQQCLVCTIPINSVHFGMDICRACSCFFKRTKTMGLQYTCRTGEWNCNISNDGKFSCRGCRLDRCIQVGIAYDGPMRVRKKPLPILQRIKEEARACTERRREQELKLIRNHGGHKRYPDNSIELYELHQDTIMEMYRISIEEFYKLFNNVFPAFAQLNDREQHLIFKDYVGKLTLVEGYHQSRQMWDGIKRNMMCSVTTFCDLENYIENGNEVSVVGYAKTMADEQNEIFLAIYNKCSPTEHEYYALMALVMSELDSACEISEEAQDIVDQYRQEVLEDLQLYYRKDLGLRDFSTRLGNLMSLNHAIQECKTLMKVFFGFYTTLFDVFMTNTLIKDFFL